MESVPLTSCDGVHLEADLLLPSDDVSVGGGVVVCHPHPRYGGDRCHPIVDALFRHLPSLGLATLRFDFRAAFGGGDAERLDVVAALDELERRVDGPLYAAGYSFGAAVALSTGDSRVRAMVAVAPPLAMMAVPPPRVPTLVLVPEHDQFTPPAAARAATAGWSDVELRTIESVDHFALGRSSEIARIAGDWLVTAE